MSRKEYNITPARGQALLNFQGRQYPTTMPLYEADSIEQVKQNTDTLPLDDTKDNQDFKNLVLQGDCLSACAYLKKENIKVDLVYIDPPFASGANYAKKIYLRNGGTEFESDGNSIGEEVMYGDIWQKEDYLNWLYERLLAIREILSETGSIYLHLDWHIGHYAKILMDEVFGEENFKNEIIWQYFLSGKYSNYFGRDHDVIFLYSKSENYNFNYTKTFDELLYMEKKNNNEIVLGEDGKEYYLYNGELRTFEKQMTEVWKINKVKRDGKEILNYATQKPEALLERIINTSSNEGMIVADFFSGSGVTATVAHKLGRKFIACDISSNALQTTRDRLAKEGANFDIYKIRDGLRLFRNPQQTKDRLFSIIEGFQPANTLQLNSDFWAGGIAQPNGTYEPVHFVDLDRKLTEQYIDTIAEYVRTIEDETDNVQSITIIYAHKDKELTQEKIDKITDERSNIKINIISLDSLLEDKKESLYTPDNADIRITTKGKQFEVKIAKFFSSYLKKKIDSFNEKKAKKSTKPIKLSSTGLELIESVQFDTSLGDTWQSNLDLEDKAKPKEKIKGVYLLDTNKFKIKIRNIAGDEIVISSDEILKLNS